MCPSQRDVPYMILIVSGPSGAGKSTLTSFLQKELGRVFYSISTTTRSIRPGEMDGRDYFFVKEDEFRRGVALGEFLEYEEVHGNLYGTGLRQFEEAIARQDFIICDVDVRGHNSIKAYFPKAKSVFITTDLDTLRLRLERRGTDSIEAIQKRLVNARSELKEASKFDYLLINDNIEESKDSVLHIAKSIYLLNHEAKLRDLLSKYS